MGWGGGKSCQLGFLSWTQGNGARTGPGGDGAGASTRSPPMGDAVPSPPRHQTAPPRITNYFYSLPPTLVNKKQPPTTTTPTTHSPPPAAPGSAAPRRGLPFPRDLSTSISTPKNVEMQTQCKERLWRGGGGGHSTRGSPKLLGLGVWSPRQHPPPEGNEH